MEQEAVRNVLEQQDYVGIKDEILEYLFLKGPCSIKTLADNLGRDIFLIQKELEKLKNVYKVKTYKEPTAKKDDEVLYKFLDARKGYVIEENGEKYIIEVNNNGNIENKQKYLITNPKYDKNQAGDFVYYESNGEEVRIIKIISRSRKKEIGTIIQLNDKKYIKADMDDSTIKIVESNDSSNLVKGDKIVFNRCRLTRTNEYSGCNIIYVGKIDDPIINTKAKLVQNGFDLEFPEETLKEADELPDHVVSEDMNGRIDLREYEIFSIDGEDTKDLDDTISLKELPNGHYLIRTNIADVPYYVRPGTALDKAAFTRGTSSYFSDYVNPMFPSKLSNGICSLFSDCDRLTATCEEEIDKYGNVCNYKFYHSVIHSKKQMTYTAADRLLANDCPQGYEDFEKTLFLMKKVKNILREKRINDGSIIIYRPEHKFVYNELTGELKLVERMFSESSQINEELALLTNKLGAYEMSKKRITGMYRVHSAPKLEKINSVIKIMISNGEKVDYIVDFTAENINKLLDYINKLPQRRVYNNLLLHAMPKAYYSTENIGHFGLGFDYYTHFTSPIRRYPDICAHRIIFSDENSLTEKDLIEQRNRMIIAAEHSSEREISSCTAERDRYKQQLAEEMKQNIGMECDAVIENIGKEINLVVFDRVFGNLNNYSLIRPKDEPYFISNGDMYRIGDTIKVVISSVNTNTGTIRFSPKKLILKKA